MLVEPEQLKAFMVDADLIDAKTFDSLLKESKEKDEKIEDLLVSRGFISDENLIKLKAYILGIPFINLEKEVIPPDVLRIIPEPIARTYNVVAFRKKGKVLEVAMLDPEDLKTIDFIKKAGDFKILPRLTNKESIKNVLRQYQESLEKEFGSIIKGESDQVKSVKIEEVEGSKEELEKAGQELPIVKIVDTLIKHAILQRASDIHIEPTEKEVLVRYRIDGVLRDAMSLPLTVSTGIVARIKILSNLKLDEHRLPQDGRFKFETSDLKYSIRVSILPVYFGEKVVMRLLPENVKGFTLEELGFWEESLERIQLALRKTSGMILATGPTGSGKT
ncbi:MAG: GspE/PulE family protein, partial [Minisyncoccia bacterium]